MHVADSLIATIIVLVVGSCISSLLVLRIAPYRGAAGEILGCLLLCGWFAIAGFAAAAHSGHYLRKRACFPLPTVLATPCTIWFSAVLLTLLFAVATWQYSWLARVLILLMGLPCIATFCWQTRAQFRQWEQEQEPPKSYGFPVILPSPAPPTPPAGPPTVDAASPTQWAEQVRVGGQTWHLQVDQDLKTGEFTVQCRELPGAIEQGSTAGQAIANGMDAIASILDYINKSDKTTATSFRGDADAPTSHSDSSPASDPQGPVSR